MKITCDSCGTSYRIADAKIAGRRAKVRCKGCGAPIIADGTALGAPGADGASAEPTSVPPASGPVSLHPEHEPNSGPTAAPVRTPPPEDDDDDATTVMDSALAMAAAQAATRPAAPAETQPSSQLPAAATAAPRPLASKPASTPAQLRWQVSPADQEPRELDVAGIVSGWKDGSLDEEAYAWREGMADWLPLLDIPELAVELKRAPRPQPPKQQDAPFAPGAGLDFSGGGARGAARVSDVGAGPDLFSGAKPANEPREASVVTSAPEELSHEAKPTGARGENSVLFSLEALQAGARATPAPSAPTPALDDLMQLGGSEGSAGLFDAPPVDLLAAPPSEDLLAAPPPDLLTAPAAEEALPAAASSLSPPVVASAPPPPRQAGSRTGLYLAAATVLLLLLGGVGAALVFTGGEDTRAEQARSEPNQAPAAARTGGSEVRASARTAEPAAPAATAGADSPAEPKQAGAPAPGEPPAAPTAATPAAAEGAAPEADAAAEPSSDEATAEAPAGADFDVNAARAALNAAAGEAAACKKPGGPTGNGKVFVTFAPSGRVTSANVSGVFAGTAVGGCVAGAFRRAKVPPFSGDHKTVGKSFAIQ